MIGHPPREVIRKGYTGVMDSTLNWVRVLCTQNTQGLTERIYTGNHIMQCNCGSETTSKVATRNKIVVTEYQECPACGRVEIIHDMITNFINGFMNFDTVPLEGEEYPCPCCGEEDKRWATYRDAYFKAALYCTSLEDFTARCRAHEQSVPSCCEGVFGISS